ncbi:MAG: ester cyclase [Nitrososphaeraceae archaeon]
MKNNNIMLAILFSILSILVVVSILTTIVHSQKENTTALQEIIDLETQVDILEKKVKMFEKEKALIQKNIVLFDKIDLEAFTNHDMKTIKEIYSDNVRVYNPDGSMTAGIALNERNLRQLFNTFPDIKITEHPIKFGFGNWTAGIGVTKGTWSNPMILTNGTVLQPTGKSFEMKIATLIKWNDGRIEEEHLFWDNEDWNKQIGLGN